MKLVMRISFVLGFLFLATAAAWAEDSPALDQQNLKDAVASRVNLLLNSQGQAGIQPVTADDIRIQKIQPVQVQSVSLYAVKLLLQPKSPMGAAEPDEMILLTDPSGSIQFGMVTDLRTGNDVAMVQASDLTRIDFPTTLATPLAHGQGAKDVIIVSDPFCPYCRQAYNFILDKLANINTLALVHLPLAMHPGADAAVWIMDYAREEAAEFYRAAVDFAYSTLRAPEPGNVESAQKNVIAQFLKRFPSLTVQKLEPFFYYLKGKYEPRDMGVRRELQKLRIGGTPVIVIDGQAVHGFDQEEITNRLSN